MSQEPEKHKPYKNDYLIYARKSTDDEDNQKNSIDYQKSELLEFSNLENLSIAKNLNIEGFCTNGIITEHHTGFKDDENLSIYDNGIVQYRTERPKFHKLLKMLYDGEVKGVIFLCWDRASRNKSDDNVIRKLMNRGVDIRFRQTTYDKSSAGELHKDIDGMFSAHYSRVVSEKVTNTTRKLRDEGICTYRAPVGYLNQGDPRNKPFDPIRAPVIKQLFEKYSEGTWSLSDLARWANEQGLTTPPSRRRRTEEEKLTDKKVIIEKVARPITFNHIHKILSNKFYLGQVLGNDGVYIKSSSHKALVSEKLFYEVQSLLKSKRVSVHYIKKPYFAYRGLVRCEYSLRVYTPYLKKDIEYYGARCPVNCSNKLRNVKAKFIEDEVGKILKGFSFSDEELVEIDARVRNEIGTLENNRKKELLSLEREKSKLREDLTYLRTNKLTLLRSSVFSPDSYVEKELDILGRISKIQEKEVASDTSMHEVVKDVILLSEMLKDAYLYYLLANPTEKKEIIQKIFSEITLSDKGIKYKCKNGFKALENKLSLMCDPIGWISDLDTLKRSFIRSAMYDLEFCIEETGVSKH